MSLEKDGIIMSKNVLKAKLDIIFKKLFSEIFDSVRYVKLETTDDILIKSIRILQYANNCVYILDPAQKTIFSFDANTGKYLWKIQNAGQGPGEYLFPMDFDIDEKNNRIYVFCRVQKVQEYDLSGNFIQEHNLQINGYSFAYDKDVMYFYCGNNPQWLDNQWKNYRLLIYDKKDNYLIEKLPYENNPQIGGVHTYGSGDKAFYHYKDKVHFFSPYSNLIYSLKGDEMKVDYRFDFGEFDFPENTDRSLYSKEELDEKNNAHGLHLCWENDQYLSANTFMKEIFYHVLYIKKEKTAHVGDFYNDMDYRSIDLVQATNDWALGYLSASSCFKENSYTESYYKGKTSPLIKKLRTEITEDDNPVLFFYYFKK